jgi:hypothetical protein
MERIEVVSTCPQFAIEGDSRQTFTANTGVDDVPINALVGNGGLLKDASGNTWLHPKDNFNILSAGITMPYSFGLSKSNPVRCQLFWRDSVNATGFFNIGSQGYLWLPFENYEMSLGLFVQWPGAAVGGIRLYFVLESAIANKLTRVSMVGAPANFNGQTLPIAAWVKVAINDAFYFV